MKHGRSQHPYGILAPAARAALRFTARRNAPGRHDAWRPVALFWRRQRKGPQGVRADRVAPAAAAVWLPQFHLHFKTRVNGRPWVGAIPGSLSTEAMYQKQLVMDYRRTIVQSSMVAAQPHCDERPVHVFSLRQAHSDSGTSVQATVPYASSARRPGPPAATWGAVRAKRPVLVFSLSHAGSDSGTSAQATVPYASSARRLIVPPIATWAADRAHSPNLGQTHLRVRLGTDAQAQPLQSLRTSKREPLVFRPRSKAVRNAAPPYTHQSTAPQPYFHPQELAWRRAVPPAAGIALNERQADSHERTHPSPDRSFPEQEATSGMPHSFGRAPAAPAMKLDSALMDRLADDVIRRVERRERIERARRGL